ncbi:MAG: periplasmic heavy metal sensor [Pyrinomonadaceae bacterium]
MRYTSLFLIFIAAIAATASGAFAQEGPPPGDGPKDERGDERRPNLLAELGLSADQLQQIGRMNQERRPHIREARRRMGDAARNLDMAIYADVVNDADVKSRLKEFQVAEAELSRLRFESELAVRKLLTPEQLVRFRELRRQFTEERRKNGPERRRQRRDRRMSPAQDQPLRRAPSQ